MDIVSDAALSVSPDSLGTQVKNGALHAPPALVGLLTRYRIPSAAYLPSLVESMPSFFIQELGLGAHHLPDILSELKDQIEPVCGVLENDFKTPPMGAMPPRSKS
jgi:hypothetical protein